MQQKLKKLAYSLGLATTALLASHNAQAEGRLTIYCTVQNALCEDVAKRFSEKYDVQTSFTQMSTGTILGKLKAEKSNPQADVWYGGTIEPHFQAAELGLLEAYRPKNQANILPQFQKLMASDKGNYTSATYMLVLGLGINSEKLKALGLEMPKKWEDLLNPKLAGEVQIPDPRSSGTTYTIMATLISLWGEEKTFDYLKKLDANISQYPKSNLVTSNLVRGEVAESIGFTHAYITEKEKGNPIEYVIPEGKVGYALGGTSIVKNARNLDNAKLFADFVLTKEIQELPWREHHLYQLPSVVGAEVSPLMPNVKQLDFVEYDFDKFGSSEEGKHLINKWVEDVKLDDKLVK